MNKLNNFRWHTPMIFSSRPVNSTLRFRDGEYGDIVEIEVRYEDGKNMLSRENFRKGIKVSITPRHVEATATPGVNIETSWLMGEARRSGRKIHILTLKRKNDNALVKVAEQLEPHVGTIVAKFREGDGMGAFDLINTIFDSTVTV